MVVLAVPPWAHHTPSRQCLLSVHADSVAVLGRHWSHSQTRCSPAACGFTPGCFKMLGSRKTMEGDPLHPPQVPGTNSREISQDRTVSLSTYELPPNCVPFPLWKRMHWLDLPRSNLCFTAVLLTNLSGATLDGAVPTPCCCDCRWCCGCG